MINYLLKIKKKKPDAFTSGILLLWWPRTGLNRRHGDFQSPALPTELPGHLIKKRLADHTGIEPVIFSVTGRHVNRYTNGPCSQRFYIIKENHINCKRKYQKNKDPISRALFREINILIVFNS